MTSIPVSTPESLPVEFLARLFSRIDMRGADECWEWTAGRVSSGYGAITLPRSCTGGVKTQARAHRLIAELFHGPPETAELMALHSCDNPPCCNPRHIRWGTHMDNVRDKVERGRQPDCISAFNNSDRNRGVNNHNARLTVAQVMEIRWLLARDVPITRIASAYGVWHNAIRQIRDGATWRHVEGEQEPADLGLRDAR